ncbi:helix-turn-helix domain-containing protein [Duganella vulcania]|uniref:helix-turn-helix domain-containing protein n=1 Tax=Duganella vulcania TaxID=2692166 RepID=UPI0035A65013
MTGISKATLRAIEADRLELTLEQATVLAKALQVTPAILMATGSDASNKSAA